jgi:hypothetical protein
MMEVHDPLPEKVLAFFAEKLKYLLHNAIVPPVWRGTLLHSVGL